MRITVVLVMLSVLAAGCEPADRAAGPDGTTPAASAPAASEPAPAPSESPSASPSPSASKSAPPAPPPGPAALRVGSRGPEVLALQRRLVELGFWLGQPDGTYGSSTAHAVTAYQKMAGLGRDGVAGARTQQALKTARRPAARSTGGDLVEVDLARQVLIVVNGGRLAWVLDASTGSRPGLTPTGRYKVFRHVDGYDHGPLGTLYRPKYFNRGVAVHGYPNVPPQPASHGCVRVTNPAMDWLWSSGTLTFGRGVWVY